MLLLLAGLESIPREYYEAARIDGASALDELRYITLPLLKPVLTVTTVLNLLYGLKVFDSVWVLTNGGPGYATETVNTIVFKEFARGHYAVSAALSTVLFLVMTTVGSVPHPGDAQADRQCLRSPTSTTLRATRRRPGRALRRGARPHHDAPSVRRGTNHAMATSVSLVMIIPIYLVVVNSLKTDAEARADGPRAAAGPALRQLRRRDRRGQAVAGVRQQHDLHGVRDRALRRVRHGRCVRAGQEPHQAQPSALPVPRDRDRHAGQLRHPHEGDADDASGEHAVGDDRPVRRVQAAVRGVRDLRVRPHGADRDRRGGDHRRLLARASSSGGSWCRCSGRPGSRWGS